MRSGWTRLVRMAAAMLALAGGLWAASAGAGEIKNVTAEYAWPWGAEIRYEVVGTIGANDPLIVKAIDRTKNITFVAASNMLSGDTGKNAGAHRIMWDLDKQGIKMQSTNVEFTVEYRGAWCVVDLSAGANATSYPVTYLNESPSGGFNTDAYKTTKLVLRRIEPGTFSMSSNSPPAQVTLTRAYYIGVFEVTQKQYELVTGENPSYTSGGAQGDKNRYNRCRGTQFVATPTGLPHLRYRRIPSWGDFGHGQGWNSTCQRRRSGNMPAAQGQPVYTTTEEIHTMI